MPERLKEETVDSWQRDEEIEGETHFRSMLDDHKVDVYRIVEDGREVLGITVEKDKMRSKISDLDLVREVYTAVEELGQTSRLMTLSKALELL